MSGPSTEAGGMPAWPPWTWPEARHLARLYREAYGVIPDDIQAHLDALDRAEQQRGADHPSTAGPSGGRTDVTT